MLDRCISDVLLLSVQAGATSGRAAAPKVSAAVHFKPQGTGKLHNEERQLATGFRVRRNELRRPAVSYRENSTESYKIETPSATFACKAQSSMSMSGVRSCRPRRALRAAMWSSGQGH